MPESRVTDRRVQKTRGLLHGALASLIHEKGYDDIVVKEILARANVGRSTFYSHFRDKGELLDSGIREMVRACAGARASRGLRRADVLLRFSLPLFEHIERLRGRGVEPAQVGRQAIVHEHLEHALAEWVIDELARVEEPWSGRARELAPELLARHVAATFVLVLEWWMAREATLRAEAANDRFRALIAPTLMAALER